MWPSTKTNMCLEVTVTNLAENVIVNMLKKADGKAVREFVEASLSSSIGLKRLIFGKNNKATFTLTYVGALGVW